MRDVALPTFWQWLQMYATVIHTNTQTIQGLYMKSAPVDLIYFNVPDPIKIKVQQKQITLTITLKTESQIGYHMKCRHRC